jgi:MFS family permease
MPATRFGAVFGGAVVVLLAVSIVHQLGTGLVLALVPMRLAIEGFPAWVAGVMSTSFSLGFIAGCLAAPRMVSRVSARAAIMVCALVNAGCAVLLWAFPDPLAWCAARLIGGYFIAALWVVIEAWLGARSTAGNRGAVFGAYMLTNRVSFVLVQAALAWTDPRLGALFLVAAAFHAVAWLPAFATSDKPPPIPRRSALRGLLAFPRLAPAAVAGALAHGLVTASQPALFPIYGVTLGLGMDRIALGLAAIQFGGMLLQLPLAFASDRWGRRRVMAYAALATAALSLAALRVPADAPLAFLALIAAWGGAPAVIYSIAIAHANDRAADDQRVAASSTLLMSWGVGATVGPMAASLGMDLWGPGALFAFTAVLGVALALYLGWRRLVRRAPPAREPVAAALISPPDLGR